MKAIIIENELSVDINIEAFLKDNPNLFESVQEELYCLNRSTEGLFEEIMQNDAIIAASTWMYKDQLLEFLLAFDNPQLTKKFKFFIHDILRSIEEWNDMELWTREPEIIKIIISLLNKGFEIYDFKEDWNSSLIRDDLNIFGQKNKNRFMYTYNRVLYNSDLNKFYLNDTKR